MSRGSQFASAPLLGLLTLTAVLMINVAFGVITRAVIFSSTFSPSDSQ